MSMTISDWRKSTASFAEHDKATGWEPLLLSNLGSLLEAQDKQLGDGRPGWLKRFLERELSDQLYGHRHHFT